MKRQRWSTLLIWGLWLTSAPLRAQPADAVAEAGSTQAAEPSVTESADDAPLATIPVAQQDAETMPERDRSHSRMIEEIVVTAQKREENLQDVPISISAFSADMLDAKGVSDPKDLPLVTPGLTIGSQAGFTVTYLRGVGSDAFLLGDPSVALYIDGVYFPFAHGQAQNFGAIERVEVLKGPQGTLFGRNAVGGAISVYTKAPSFTDNEISLQTTYQRFNDVQTRAHVNVPISDNFAVSVSGIYSNADNFRDGTINGNPMPQEIARGARVKLRWDPIENLDLTLAGFHIEQTGVSTMFATNSDPAPDFRAVITPQIGYDGANDAGDYFNLSNTVIYGQGTLNTDWFDVKLIASDQRLHTESAYDFDGSPTPLVYFEAFQFADVRTAEAQIVSNADSWASDKLKWIAGYYFFKGRQGLDPVHFGVAGSVLDGVNELLAPVFSRLNIPPLLNDGELNAVGILDTDSNSIYAQGTYNFTDWAALTIGGRLQEEKRTIVDSSGAVNTPGDGPGIKYTDFSGNSDTTRSFSPKISPEFRLWDGGLLYLSYQTATKSSTFNVVNFLRFTQPEVVKAEKLTAYEVGLKTDLFEGSTRLSTAAFWYEIRNDQVQFISLLAGGAVTFQTAPASRVRGVDFDVTSQLFPSVFDGLVLTLGGAVLDPRYTDFPCGQGFNNLGVYTACNDYTGQQIVRSPKFSGTVGLSQTFDVPGGSLELATDYYYNSGFYYLPQNTDFNHENAYGVMGARISYLYEQWNLRMTVFGKNVLNEKYNYSRFTNDFGALDALAPPAVYGVRLNWDF